MALSGSFQTAPNFWLSPRNGVSYNVVTQAQQHDMDSLTDLRNIPLGNAGGAQEQLSDVASIQRGMGLASVSHYNITPVIDIIGAVRDEDLAPSRPV